MAQSQLFTSDNVIAWLAALYRDGRDVPTLQQVALLAQVQWSDVLLRVAELDCDVLVRRVGEPVVVRLVEASTN